MISKILAPLLLVTVLNAATYDENYRVVDLDKTIKENFNLFMHGDFESIIRYDMINMDGEYDDNSSVEVVDAASKEIKRLQDNEKSVKVTIIGHTNRPTDDMNERKVDSDTYAKKIQNWFAYSLETNSSKEKSQNYALEIQDALIDAGVDKNITYVEVRAGLDQGFTEATSEGRNLSNRVMVTVYVSDRVDIDSDRDGVFDRVDKCPASPRGYSVDKDGCSIDSDRDGVLDYKDKCPKTPKGVKVTPEGCPMDSDKDGVYDYLDKCPQTPLGLQVDKNGCPLSSKLHLNFQTSSDKILKESYSEIQRFAKFLKENPVYKAQIIGHTDSRGKAALNMDLSQRRATSVKAALIAEGIDASRITASGRGELDPIMTNRTKEGRLLNRRTEVKLSY
ncbi:OmpA family protein [Sulfurimonas sp. SAG-AH-194-C20]|nr:OmpA family protein [Sulfurimonas sp. SAG-AH-194-C20]MDF1879388.1 OmpA family protein [Sulfurimonas sp. SAG-AH-194-C20]